MINFTKIFILLLLVIIIVEGYIIKKVKQTYNDMYLPSYYFSEYDKKYEDNFFSAKGSWVSETKLANPYQTTEINCFKDSGLCYETNAYITEENLLSVYNEIHEIDKWNPSLITTKPNLTSFKCVEYQINIDRVNKTVTSLRTTKDNKTGLCKGVSDEPIVMQLQDGENRIHKIQSQELLK